MNEHFEHMIKFSTMTIYSFCMALLAIDWIKMLDTHAPAFGIIITFCTFLMNWYYQHRNRQLLIIRNGERRYK